MSGNVTGSDIKNEDIYSTSYINKMKISRKVIRFYMK